MTIQDTIRTASATVVGMYSKEYVLRRRAAGSYSTTTGLFVDGALTEISLWANIQPVVSVSGAKNGSILKAIPEGRVSDDMIWIATQSQLQKEDDTGLKADIIVRNGVEYEVVCIQDWNSYVEAVAVKVGV